MDKFTSKWQSFEQSVIGKGAPEIQRREMKMAFYAGAYALFNLMDQAADLPTEEAADAIDVIYSEVHAFLAGVTKSAH